MQISSPSSQAVLQKFGFLIMAPIAVMVHGVFLLIPFSQEQKAKEPEKKEEILSIGSIAQLPAGQALPIATSASPAPKPSPSAAPIVQQQRNPAPAPIVQPQTDQQPARTPDNSSEVQQLQKKLEDLQNKVKQQATPITPTQTAPVVPPVIVSHDVINSLPGAKSCPGNKNCFIIPSQAQVKTALKEQFKKDPEDIIVIADGDERTVGFKIDTGNNAGETDFFYYVNTIQLHKTSKELTIAQLKDIGIDVAKQNN